MFRVHRALHSIQIPLAAVIAVSACAPAGAGSDDDPYSKVLGSIHIQSGQHIANASTVNGAIDVGENAATSNLNTVNGSIRLHANSGANSAATVNGAISLDEGAHVTGAVSLVNGGITLLKGAEVGGRITNVNGSIKIEGAHVGGRIETTSGDINISDGSHVDGGILVNENDSWFHYFQTGPVIVVGPGAVVGGALKFHRQVKLYISDRATIGSVEGATPIKFSGDQPPS